ncbi:hypothetical protein [Cupriavidus sp. WS]|uniref:hypothetical protein n=1 Tax=Cupriavidus sp. WS TaxID=1312922 RepID=UPI00036269A9|nr:hypothetical protein [Cupriavidus sp. WS]
MRFHIVCVSQFTNTPYLEEVIGHTIEIPGMPASSCAVHALVNNGAGPVYAVSHVESGWRVAAGDSIDSAIRLARDRVAATNPAVRDAGLKKAIALRRKLARGPARQHLTAVPTSASIEANPSTKESA